MAGRAKKKCLFEDDVRAMLGMPKVASPRPAPRGPLPARRLALRPSRRAWARVWEAAAVERAHRRACMDVPMSTHMPKHASTRRGTRAPRRGARQRMLALLRRAMPGTGGGGVWQQGGGILRRQVTRFSAFALPARCQIETTLEDTTLEKKFGHGNQPIAKQVPGLMC